ncbi:MAG: PepSY domain-containing protein [Candidatus Eremiobacteraeota bacterium]|nr:PepSY domain-containing protein [Candidatus Eremiobacteraeota bacterium]
MKITTFTALLASTTFAVATAATMPALTGANLQPQAKVSLAAAQAKALATEHGVIVAQELEKEAHGLRYSFDIKVGKRIHEVGIDAISGKVLEDSIDNGKD